MRSLTELVDELSTWGVGLGTITLALFPLAIPLVLLTVATLVPLVLLALAGAVVVAMLAAPILLVRRIRSRVGRRPPRSASRRTKLRPPRRRRSVPLERPEGSVP